ncbi:MAG TPA: 3'-5' exonuclease, partial [Allocoleopsis sp.]
FRENPESNAAILVRENRQVQFLAYELQNDLQNKNHIKVFTVSENEGNSEIPEEMFRILQFLDRPHSVEYLKNALQIMLNRKVILAQDIDALATIPEMFLYPGPLNGEQNDNIKQASHFCRSLLNAKLELSSYHLIRFIALSLKYDNSELATAEKLAENVARQNFIKSSLKSTIEALKEIIKNKKFKPVDIEENDDRYTVKGQLTIMTMHKSKGLDWDYVFIPFLTKDIIPGSPYVPSGGEFLGDFTLAEVARVQMRASLDLDKQSPLPNEMQAWKQAEFLKTTEEFRLIYVAMTRAKKLLWMAGEKTGPFSWNLFEPKNGTNCGDKKDVSPIITALIKAGFGSDRF